YCPPGWGAWGCVGRSRAPVPGPGDLQAARGAREAHRLDGAARYVAHGDAAPAEQVRGAGQDLQRRDPAIGERAAEARILRPDAVLGPDFGTDRIGRLVAVLMCLDARARIVAEMGMDVDHSGRHPAASPVDAGRAVRDRR